MVEPSARIGAVLVNYHKAARVIESVASLAAQTCADRLDIVVVDNSADERQAAILREGLADQPCELVIAPGNLGYTRGVNLGARALSSSGHMLLVNPDIVIDDSDAVAALIDQLDAHGDVGISAAMQVTDDGDVVEIARRFPSLPRLLLRRLLPGRLTDYDLLKPLIDHPERGMIDVDWVQSSFTLVRDTVWQRLGGLDELYEIFMADTALGADAQRMGYRVVVSNHATVRSDGIRASRGGIAKLFKSRALRIHLKDALKYELVRLLAPFRRQRQRGMIESHTPELVTR